MAKVYDNTTDLIAFARSSSGTALRRVGYGENLVDKHDFATGDLTRWAVSGSDATHSVTYSSGGARYQSDTTSPVLKIAQNDILEVGKLYQITVETTAYTSGKLKTDNFSGPKILSEGLGTVTINAVASSTNLAIVRNSTDVDITFDNISVREVIFDRPTDPLVLFNHPDDIPRIEYGPDGSLKGLLIEEQRTNLFPSSNDFTTWAEGTTSGATTGLRYIQENVAVGPNGQISAHKLVESTDNDQQRIYDAFYGMTANTDYTYSVFLKAGERTEAFVRTTGTSGMLVDLSDGTFTVIGGSNHDVQPVGNSWYRCSFTVNEPGTFVVPWINISSGGNATYTGDGTSGIYVYGAQLEEGSFATSYIPTSGSQVTREPDIASIPVTAFGYNQDAGTVVVEATPIVLNSGNLLNLNTAGSDATSIYANPNTSGHLVVRNTTTQVNLDAGSFASGQASKLGLAIKENDFAVCLDAGTVASDNSGTLPSPIATMAIGSTAPHNGFCNSHIKSLKYFPRRLTDAQLQELTA